MIRIDYTEEYLVGQPGPNFYWMGNQYDYISILASIHPLACADGVEIVLTDLPQITEINGFKVVGRSTESEKWYLAKKTGKEIAMEVGCGLWKEILVSFLRITFSPCHDYLDFDEDEFFEGRIQEGANFVISSEW